MQDKNTLLKESLKFALCLNILRDEDNYLEQKKGKDKIAYLELKREIVKSANLYSNLIAQDEKMCDIIGNLEVYFYNTLKFDFDVYITMLKNSILILNGNKEQKLKNIITKIIKRFKINVDEDIIKTYNKVFDEKVIITKNQLIEQQKIISKNLYEKMTFGVVANIRVKKNTNVVTFVLKNNSPITNTKSFYFDKINDKTIMLKDQMILNK